MLKYMRHVRKMDVVTFEIFLSKSIRNHSFQTQTEPGGPTGESGIGVKSGFLA